MSVNEDVKLPEASSQDVSSQQSSQTEDVYWPRDLLKEDLPTARIMTFGYNSRVPKGYEAANQGSIFSHARDLLYALDTKRRKARDRKLVFIAHSLGGILVKEVLRRSETDPDDELNKIFESTGGVFFFGTPHRGSDGWASFGEGVAGVASRLLGVDKNDLTSRRVHSRPHSLDCSILRVVEDAESCLDCLRGKVCRETH